MKVIAFFEKVLKTVHPLRINGTKFRSRNAFISNPFVLESEKKNQEKRKELSFRAPRGVLTCLLTLRLQKLPI